MKQVTARPQSAARSAGLRVWNAARLLLLVVAATLMARNIALLGDRCRWVVACPYENEYGEGILLWNAGMFAQGRSPYHDYNHYPFVAATYPPVYPLAAAVGVKLFGVSMAFGRVLSCLATLAVVGLIWVIVRRTVRARASPWLGSALFLAAPIVLWWAPLMRVEMAAVAVGLAGLYCVLRGGRWLLPAVVLLAVAVYTRQSAVAAAAAAVVYLAWIGRRRSAALVAISWAVLVLGVFAVMQVSSHGWFYRNLVVANWNLWVPAGLWRLWKAAFLSWPLPFLMGAIGAAVVLVDAGIAAFRRQSHRSDHADRSAVRPLLLFGLYFVFAMAASLTAGKIGANINYMIEPLAAACIMTGFAYDWLAGRLASWPGRLDRRRGHPGGFSGGAPRQSAERPSAHRRHAREHHGGGRRRGRLHPRGERRRAVRRHRAAAARREAPAARSAQDDVAFPRRRLEPAPPDRGHRTPPVRPYHPGVGPDRGRDR